MTKYNGKPVGMFDPYNFEKTKNGVQDRDFVYENSYYFVGENVILGEFDNKDIKTVKQLPKEAALYFDKACKFPRFKLNGQFKRTIKVDKADAIVITKSNRHYDIRSTQQGVLIEFEKRCVFVENVRLNSFKNIEDFIKNVEIYGNNVGKFVKIVHTGKITTVAKSANYLYEIYSGNYAKPIILSCDLDKLINKEMQELDYDQLKSIEEMLASKDLDIVKMALTTLCGFNVDQYKLTLRVIFYLNRSWTTVTGVAKDNLCNALDIGFIPALYLDDRYGLHYAYDTKEVFSEEDVAMAKKFAAPYFKSVVERIMNDKLLSDPRLPKVEIKIYD